MGTSTFLARIIGPYCIIVGIGIFFNRETYQKIMGDFLKNAALVYMGGAMALIIGLLVVLVHNVWVADWPVIITIFGWSGIIKGTWLFVFPNSVTKFTEAYQRKASRLIVHVVLIMVIGMGLTFFGYFAG